MSFTGEQQMRPEKKSTLLLGVTRSKAKMLEYDIPQEHHIKITQDPKKLFTLTIGMLGDLAAAINRGELGQNDLSELKTNLLFSARFFDSYLQSKLNEVLDPYLVLLGSSSYYLCDLPGSASVLAKRIKSDCPNLEGEGLEDLLLWLLQGDLETYFDESEGAFGKYIDGVSKGMLQYFEDGSGESHLINLAKDLRAFAYESGTPRQLLFCDVIAAVLEKKLENSTWKALPSYSGLPKEKWLHALQKTTFIKELWPAQHLLGQAGVLKGESAIVQMPTSAGKTKATEIILRSAFLADRVSLSIIIAPFRALCHEIKNSLADAFHGEAVKVDELSDALQTDFEISKLLGHQQILVVTPEKLLYVLRHAPELAAQVGLEVFDEGHQFDSGTRGITYELLLTSLRSMLPEETQKVLVSAVISNAEAVGEWLNGEPNAVEGSNLIPTFRSVGFASWLDQLGRIEYVDSQNAEKEEFFVPRVIERFNLGTRGKERKDRFFPEKKTDSQEIALYLGLKLVGSGSIAIFCGKKSTAANMCEKAIKAIERNVPLPLPSDFSHTEEVERLTNLHVQNLGADASSSRSAAYGIFSHHGNTPHGIRLAVEHAMRNDLIRLVVCTSTLAQGVNLPIRYLIVSGVYKGMERIKVRDFHNLIGRAGRAGMHTEGSILFADPMIYDKKRVFKARWRWQQVKELLEPSNAEPCISNLLSIFDPIKNDDESRIIKMEALDFTEAYIENPDQVLELANDIAKQHGASRFSREGVERQVTWRVNLISAIESFLLSHWDESADGLSETDATSLAEETLAFHLADNEKKELIKKLFHLLAKNISENMTDPVRRKIYGRTLYGIQDAQLIEQWVKDNADALLSTADENEILDLLWPLIVKQIKGGVFSKYDKPDVLQEIAHGWISGKPFSDLLQTIHTQGAKMIWGTRRREFQIDHVVETCEGALAYDGALIIGAVSEFVEALDQAGSEDAVHHLQLLQKRLKYGLPTDRAIALYELGLSDRVISQDLEVSLNLFSSKKKSIVEDLKQERELGISIISKYPIYFQERFQNLLQDA